MTRKFSYKKKSSTSIWPVLVFAGLTVACVVFQYGIAIRNFKLLAYPNSAIVLAVITVGWSVYYFLERRKEKASNANPDYIETDETGLHFTTSKGEFTVAYADVAELYHKEDEDDVSAIIYIKPHTPDFKRYEWLKEGFASPLEFDEFEKILNTCCTNITNR
jgi:hypothetical protein